MDAAPLFVTQCLHFFLSIGHIWPIGGSLLSWLFSFMTELSCASGASHG